MRWNGRDRADPLGRLRRVLTHGKRWCQVYWQQVFEYEGFAVNAASIPVYWLQMVERGELTIEQVARLMAERSSGKTDEHLKAYQPLWDEAVTYVLGVRQDILRANAAAEFAYQMAQKGEWLNAFRAATIAFDTEVEHSGNAHYWHPFLYSLSDVLIALDYARSYYDLRSLAKASVGVENPRPLRRGRNQRKRREGAGRQPSAC